jgi:hypothetical protein
MRILRLAVRHAAAVMLLAAASVAHALVAPGSVAAPPGAAALRARHAELRPALENNAFGRPIHLVSQEGEQQLNGDIHALVAHPFDVVSESLQRASDWCEILIMPFNTKLCTTTAAGDALSVYVGRKNNVEPRDAHRLDFSYKVAAKSADYLRLELRAAEGPLGTRDYVITLEVTPIDARRSFLHLSYSYAYGTVSRVAMQAYLATIGRNKVGFSQVERDGGRTELVRGMRGIMERNTMRYYLAIEAYLNSLSAPEQTRVQKRLSEWYAASAMYPRQLSEMERAEYLAMKQREIQRMHSPS